jgi:hypothetical protein
MRWGSAEGTQTPLCFGREMHPRMQGNVLPRDESGVRDASRLPRRISESATVKRNLPSISSSVLFFVSSSFS